MNFSKEKEPELKERLVKEKETVGGQLKKIIGVTDVSAARGNLFSLNRNMIQLYLSIKRFNGENKQQNI